MGSFSVWHWLVLGVVVLLLFGKGRFSEMMGDVAKGLKSFKKGMTEDDDAPAKPAPRLQTQSPMEPSAERDLKPMADDRPRD